jgi:hypothetical protein
MAKKNESKVWTPERKLRDSIILQSVKAHRNKPYKDIAKSFGVPMWVVQQLARKHGLRRPLGRIPGVSPKVLAKAVTNGN